MYISDIDAVFIPGHGLGDEFPLSRYLTPLMPGIISEWLRRNIKVGSWVLDPFGSTPALALEVAKAGYKIIVASNNPIISFMMEILGKAYQTSEFQSALAEFGSARHGNDRMEIYLRSLYYTECTACSRTIDSTAFLWRRDEAQPFAKLYHCPYCGDEGERVITNHDIDRLNNFGNDRLHRMRAVQRIGIGTENLVGVEEAMRAYLPRPLYFIFTALNKIEGLSTTNERRNLLLALLICLFDDANVLWVHPSGRQRPKQLTIPPQFRENNLWISLETSSRFWDMQLSNIPVTKFPETPGDGGGICIFNGRASEMNLRLFTYPIKAIIGAIPRPNQAFWTLSALWSGWLWGREAVIPLKSALERKRYDWQWHTNALFKLFQGLRNNLPPDTIFFGVASELVSGYLLSMLSAANCSGWQLLGLAMRSDSEIAQFKWKNTELSNEKSQFNRKKINEISKEAINLLLTRKNEPASYLELFGSAVSAIINQGYMPRSVYSLPDVELSEIQMMLETNIMDEELFAHYTNRNQKNKKDKLLRIGKTESGLWSLLEQENNKSLPISESIEIDILRFLRTRNEVSLSDLDEELCEIYRGLLTPSYEWIEACLDSYGEATLNIPRKWYLKQQEELVNRKNDILVINNSIEDIGKRLKFQCLHEKITINSDNGSDEDIIGDVIIWFRNDLHQNEYVFIVLSIGIISPIVFNSSTNQLHSPFINQKQSDNPRNILVIPGSRAKLLSLKLERDPRIAEIIEKNWQIIKFRHIRRIAEREDLSLLIWEKLLGSDPIQTEEETQMYLFK